MARPDEPDDADGFVPPLPPEDRLWRHPSEMGAGAAPPTPPGGSVGEPGPQGDGNRGRTVVLAVTAGVVATLALLTVLGRFETPPAEVAVEQVLVTLPDEDATTPAESVGPSLARLDARSGDTTVTVTAVVYRSDGHLLTTAKDVADADELRVTLHDGRVFDAALVGTDDMSGVAVVKVDADGLPSAVLATDESDVGDEALVVSHAPDPGGSPAVSGGMIRGTGWRVDVEDATWHDVIGASFDGAAAEQGAVVCSRQGAVLGLVLAAVPVGDDDHGALTPTSSTAGAGVNEGDGDVTTSPSAMVHYVAPIDTAVRAADELVATGRTNRAWLGVKGDDLEGDRAAELGRTAVLLTEVGEGSPAEEAGLRSGDVLLSVDSAPVLTVSGLVVAIRDRRPADVVEITVLRDGDTLTIPVILGTHS